MGGVAVRVEVDDEAVRAALGRLIDRGEDFSPAMDAIGGMLVESTRQRFERGAGPGGVPWPPSIRAQAEGGQTLVDSARLRDSFTHVFGRAFTEAGTNVVYAAIQHFGGTVRAKNAPYLQFRVGGRWARKKSVDIPARPFVGVDDDDRDEIVAILTDFVEEAWQ